MVRPESEGSPLDSKLTPATPGIFEVVVPVFMRVQLKADDELAAECAAVEVLRSIGQIRQGKALINLGTHISPIATRK